MCKVIVQILEILLEPKRVAVRLRSGSTNSDTTGSTATTSYSTLQKLFDTDPNTSAWTSAGINAAEVGFTESVAGSRFTCICYSWTPAVNPRRNL